MRRARLWISLAIGLLVLVAVVLLALPEVVRWLAVRQLSAMTGREVSIADVDLNLFTRRLAATDVRVPSTADGPPLLQLDRLEADFRLRSLLRGHVDLGRLALVRPAVRVVRAPTGEFEAEDVFERLFAPRPDVEPTPVSIDVLVLTEGSAVLEDRALDPPQTWGAEQIELTGRDLSTEALEPHGTLQATLVMAGAPATLDAEEVGLRPLQGRARTSLEDVDLASIAGYFPADAPVVLEGGRYTATHTLTITPDGAIVAGGDGRVADLVIGRPGFDEPLVTAAEVVLTARNLRYAGGALTGGRLELRSSPSVLDVMLSPAPRRQLRDLHLVVDGGAFPGEAPAAVSLTAGLPAGASLDVQGTVRAEPVVADLDVRLAGLDVMEVRPYLPPDLPVALGGGRLGAALDVHYTGPATLRAGGRVTIADFVLLREGQRLPFIRHRKFEAQVSDLTLAGRDLSAGRVVITGAPDIVDGSVSPPQRYVVTALRLVVEDASWPVRGPARVSGTATLDRGARGTLSGQVNPATLSANLEGSFLAVPLDLVGPYLPADSPVTVDQGRASVDFRLRHERQTGVRLSATGALTDFALGGAGQEEPYARDSRLALSVTDLRVSNGAVTAGRVTLAGAPSIVVPGWEPTTRLDLRGFSLEAQDVGWPATGPGRAQVAIDLPEAGRLEATGTVDARTWAVNADLRLRDAAVAPYVPLIPIEGALGGRVDLTASVQMDPGGEFRLSARGDVAARDLRLGPADRPTIDVPRAEAGGVEVTWPERIAVQRLVFTGPAVLVERTEEGRFPIRAMLAPERDADEPGDPPAASPGPAHEAGVRPGVDIAVRELRVADGSIRYIDRTTTPFFSEELSRLDLTLRDLSTAREGPATLALQGVLGADAALVLEGVVEPFGQPFFLEVEGELRRFSVPRTNPYLRRILNWIARRGELSTKLHYRIVGRELEGTNEITVQRLDVERARADDEVTRAVGLPLALIVSLLKHPRGDIHLTIPVAGEIGSPEFGLGDAITTALRNIVRRVVTGPFAAIGRLFRDGEEAPAELRVDPLQFPPGAIVIDAEAERHLQRVADFLREAPGLEMTVQPVVTAGDLQALRRGEVVLEVQRLQREQRLDTFEAAAAELFARRFPGRPLPERPEAVVDALAEQVSLPPDAAQRLASRRLETTRQALIEQAGIEPARLLPGEPVLGAPDPPRVEFDLVY
jgi:hypothetical protein